MTLAARRDVVAVPHYGDERELPHGRGLMIGLAALAALVVLVAELLYYPGMALLHEDALLRVVVDAAVGGAYLAMGLVAWSRRPDSLVGLLLYLSGLLFFAGNYSWANVPVIHHLGVALSDASVVLVGIAVIGYPSGRLREPPARILAVVATAWVLATGFLTATQLDPSRCDVQVACPSNPFRLDLGPGFAIALDQVARLGAVVLWIAFLALVAARWWRATPAARRILRPLWVAGALVAVSRVGEPVVRALLGSDAASLYVSWVSMPAVIGVPVALAYGLVKGRLEQAAVSDLVVRLRSPSTDRPLASSVADALGDPGLTLAFPGPDGGLVDADGAPVPPPHDGQRSTVIEGPRGTTAVLIHDASLAANPGLIRSVAAATGLALENERLAAEVELQLDEVRASRARLAEAAMEERARLERDLHDGAQQRLVALALRLRAIGGSAPDDATADAIDASASELDEALAELRELARGLHPTAVVHGGLATAVESLAERAHVPVDVDVAPDRWPAAIEVGAWFVITEALTNATRYADAHRVTIRVQEVDGILRVMVEDDGVGGADQSGAGLTGLADRVAALGGRLSVTEGAGGRGTTVQADIPVAP